MSRNCNCIQVLGQWVTLQMLGRCCKWQLCVPNRSNLCTFDVTMVKSSSTRRLDDLILRMGYKEVAEAETELLHLFAKHILSAPHCQVFLPNGGTVVCIPLVHGSYPTAMNCCELLQVYTCWWFILQNGHEMDVWPFSMSNPYKKHTFQLLYLFSHRRCPVCKSVVAHQGGGSVQCRLHEGWVRQA